MSSNTILHNDVLLQRAREQEIVLQRRRAQAHAEFLYGIEALDMREIINDIEDLSFMHEADMRRISAQGMRTREREEVETRRNAEAYALQQMHQKEDYHRQQQEEAIQITTALRSARENMQQNAAAAGKFPSPLAAGYLQTNVERFSDRTRHALVLHEQGLRERAMVSAHAERMRMDALRLQSARLPQNTATHARLTGNYPVPHGQLLAEERDAALASAHAERMRMDALRLQSARLPQNPATHARLTGNYPVPYTQLFAAERAQIDAEERYRADVEFAEGAARHAFSADAQPSPATQARFMRNYASLQGPKP